MATVYAPNEDHDGVTAGVQFFRGMATCDDPAKLAWFERHGYAVEHDPTEPEEPESKEPEVPVKESKEPEEPVKESKEPEEPKESVTDGGTANDDSANQPAPESRGRRGGRKSGV